MKVWLPCSMFMGGERSIKIPHIAIIQPIVVLGSLGLCELI